MKEVIDDYCNSVAPAGYLFSELLNIREATDFTFGLETYSLIEQYIRNIMDCHESCDLRLLHVLYQHKILWLERVKYLRTNNYISANIADELINMASSLVHRADILRKYAIKYDLTDRTNSLSEILLLLPEIKGMDKALCEKLLTVL